MGQDDRDYRKESRSRPSAKDDDITFRAVAGLLGKLIAIFIILIISFRIPPVWIKIPLAIAILYLGWRWVFRPAGKSKPVSSTTSKRDKTAGDPVSLDAESYNEGVLTLTEAPEHSRSEIPGRLIALDASGEFGKAKTLIQSIDGEEFSTEQAEELAIIAKNYFPVRLEPTERGARLILE